MLVLRKKLFFLMSLAGNRPGGRHGPFAAIDGMEWREVVARVDAWGGYSSNNSECVPARTKMMVPPSNR